jgi:hypothetical protein
MVMRRGGGEEGRQGVSERESLIVPVPGTIKK